HHDVHIRPRSRFSRGTRWTLDGTHVLPLGAVPHPKFAVYDVAIAGLGRRRQLAGIVERSFDGKPSPRWARLTRWARLPRRTWHRRAEIRRRQQLQLARLIDPDNAVRIAPEIEPLKLRA